MKFTRERIADFWHEAKALIAEHQLEVGRPIELADQATYERLNDAGMVAFCMRDGETLVGYATFVVGKFPQQPGVTQGIQDALYVRPKARGSASGRFILWIEKELIDMGAERITWMIPDGERFGWLLRMGYEPEYRAFSRTV